MTALEAYGALEALTREIAELANTGEWEGINELAESYARLAQDIRGFQFSEAESETAGTLIRAILEHQRVIEQHAGPWMDEARALFRAQRAEAAIAKIYTEG